MALIVGGTTVTGTQTLDATKLTGNLPEISGADLTNLPAPSASDIGSSYATLGAQDVGGVFAGFFNGTASNNSPGHTQSTQIFYAATNSTGGINTGNAASGTSMIIGRPTPSTFTTLKRIS